MKKEVRDILASDLLERYILGDVTELEKAKVLSLRQASDDIRKALDELEESLEKLALEHKVKAPSGLRDRIIEKDYNKKNAQPAAPAYLRWMAYAAFLGIGIACTWFVLNQKIADLQEQTAALNQQVAQLEADCRLVNLQFAFINDENTIPAVLKGTAFAPQSEVVVFWNAEQKDCLLRVSQLPDIPSDKTYQLWADVEGEMLSLGTFDHQTAKQQLIPMAYIDDAESLNITVEKAGGSDHPDVSTLSAVAVI